MKFTKEDRNLLLLLFQTATSSAVTATPISSLRKVNSTTSGPNGCLTPSVVRVAALSARQHWLVTLRLTSISRE